jgi:LysM repeat protein
MSRGFISPDSRGTLLTRDEDTKTKKTKSKCKSQKNHFASGAYSEIQAQNVKTARVYVFGQADIDDDNSLSDNGMEMSELRPRGATGRRSSQNNNTSREKEDVFEMEINDGDTLQSIALQYGCQVWMCCI